MGHLSVYASGAVVGPISGQGMNQECRDGAYGIPVIVEDHKRPRLPRTNVRGGEYRLAVHRAGGGRPQSTPRVDIKWGKRSTGHPGLALLTPLIGVSIRAVGEVIIRLDLMAPATALGRAVGGLQRGQRAWAFRAADEATSGTIRKGHRSGLAVRQKTPPPPFALLQPIIPTGGQPMGDAG